MVTAIELTSRAVQASSRLDRPATMSTLPETIALAYWRNSRTSVVAMDADSSAGNRCRTPFLVGWEWSATSREPAWRR